MKIGLCGINYGIAADPEIMIEVACAADAAGLDSVWTGEHIVLPDPRVPPSPFEPEMPFLESLVALSHVAAHTTNLRLGTGIIVLPQRNPIVLAKELATLDVVSKGRLEVGVGAGYLEPEFRAIGAPFEDRGTVTDESIEVIKALWTMEKPSYEGRHFSFMGIDAQPRPVQKPHPPIVIGGYTRRAARRVASYGNGFCGFEDVDRTAEMKQWIDGYDRPRDLGEIEISVLPPGPMDAEVIDRYAQIGVHRLVPYLTGDTRDEVLAFVDELGALAART